MSKTDKNSHKFAFSTQENNFISSFLFRIFVFIQENRQIMTKNIFFYKCLIQSPKRSVWLYFLRFKNFSSEFSKISTLKSWHSNYTMKTILSELRRQMGDRSVFKLKQPPEGSCFN
jgi:hypothetical protein